jgi:hypothetical protein
MKVWKALQQGKRFVLVIAHRRWGKDELGLRWMSRQTATKPANYFYFLPETEHVRRALWTSINPQSGKRRIDETWPEPFRRGELKDKEMALETHTNARVQFMGSDNYDAIVGSGPHGLGFSEWALADPQAFALLKPILVENKGWAVFLTTARGKNHVYTMMQEMKDEPEWAVFVEPADRTGVFTPEQLEAERRSNVALYGPAVGESLWRQEYFCTFEETVPGALYADLVEAAEKEGRVAPLAVPLDEPVYAAFDIGFKDATAIWYAQVRADGWVDLVGYEEYRRKSVGDLVQILKTHDWNYGALLLPHDAAATEVTSGQTVQTIFEKFGFTTAIMPPTQEAAQIQAVRLLLPRCHYQETETERGRTCLKAYHLKRLEDFQDFSMKAVHDWSSHGAKAMATLAYFAPSLRGGAKGARIVPGLLEHRAADWQNRRDGTGWMG